MMVMAFQSSPIFSLPRARLECSEVIFRFMRSVGVCVLLIIMDGPGEKHLASVKRYEGDPPEGAPKVRLRQGSASPPHRGLAREGVTLRVGDAEQTLEVVRQPRHLGGSQGFWRCPRCEMLRQHLYVC